MQNKSENIFVELQTNFASSNKSWFQTYNTSVFQVFFIRKTYFFQGL